MKTLSEYEKDFKKNFKPGRVWKPANLLCDLCGSELEVNDDFQLTSYPPQYRVRCTNCDFEGTMH